MKHTPPAAVALAFLLLSGCVAPPGQPSPSVLLGDIEASERRGLDALKTGDLATFGGSTAQEAVFIDPHGIAGKAEVMANVTKFRLEDYAMEDVRLVPLPGNCGLIAYKLTERGTSHGREFKATVYVSSIWEMQGGRWMCLFSQETGVK
jgi:hypothetical protein